MMRNPAVLEDWRCPAVLRRGLSRGGNWAGIRDPGSDRPVSV